MDYLFSFFYYTYIITCVLLYADVHFNFYAVLLIFELYISVCQLVL